jgi:ElaB/YqjD/DUF883 family membrane-anchored ribosome-binding protein
MITNPSESTHRIGDAAAQSAEQAIKSTQNFANGALDGLSNTVKDLQEQVASLAGCSLDGMREGSQKIREQAQHASDKTLGYIKHEPLKAVLVAAATGAVLMALIGLMSKSRHS